MATGIKKSEDWMVFISKDKSIPQALGKIDCVVYRQMDFLEDAIKLIAAGIPSALLFFDDPSVSLKKVNDSLLKVYNEERVKKNVTVPIIVSIGENEVEEAIQYMAEGAITYFVIRPFSHEQLYCLVKGALLIKQQTAKYFNFQIYNYIDENGYFISDYLQQKKAAFPYKAHNFFEKIGAKEQDVCRLVLAGFSNKETARFLKLSVNTIKNHLNNIYRKLDVHSRNEMRYLFEKKFS